MRFKLCVTGPSFGFFFFLLSIVVMHWLRELFGELLKEQRFPSQA
jgi:hypothetical protein